MRGFVAAVLCLALCATAPAPRGAALRRFDTPYYVVHTDLPPEGAAEAVVRMTRLGDELRRRTRELGFNGRIEQRLPFFLYARHADFLAATGEAKTSAGVFLGDRLVAAGTDARGSAAWPVVQHESFHQFAAATTGTELPAWLNEGLGEYFGEALFTGDGYTTGVVPAWRAARVKQSLKDNRFEPLAGFALLSQDEWNREMTMARYDQAWSMVQFLLHADDARHRQRLVRYVKALCSGRSVKDAWSSAFGDRTDLEAEWKDYWLDLAEHGTPDVYAEATVATFTSFLARATAAGQGFESFADFTRAAEKGEIQCGASDWLPPYLLRHAIESARKDGVNYHFDQTTLIARLPTGEALRGSFTLRDGRVAAVTVEREPATPEP